MQTGRYFLGGANIGDTIRLGMGVNAILRQQYDLSRTGGDVGVELVINSLVIEVRSSDTEETCSLFNSGSTFYNIRGDGYSRQANGVYLHYVIGVTDPLTSPCRNHPVRRDSEIRLD